MIVAAVLCVAILVGVVIHKDFTAKIDDALAKHHYFTPPGESVSDIYWSEAKDHPGAPEVHAAAQKISAQLSAAGEAELLRFYKDSQTDLGWEDLEKYFSFLEQLAPDNKGYKVRHAYAEGQRKLNKDRDHRAAFEAYSRALAADPSYVLALNGIAKVYMQETSPLHDEQTALKYYVRATEVDPNFTWAAKNLGEYYMRREEWTTASSYMKRALATSPNRPSVLGALGRISFNQRRYADARDYYSKALEVTKDPDETRRFTRSLEQVREKLHG